MNTFVYKKTRKECIGMTDVWVKQAINEVLGDLTETINRLNGAPPDEQLTRFESVLRALKDELAERTVK